MPAYVRTPDGRLETHGDDTAGTPLGVVSQAVYESIDIALPAGSVVVLYTDGISEATNADGELFGELRVAEFVQALPRQLEARDIGERLLAEVELHLGNVEAQDDRTLVVLCVGDDVAGRGTVRAPAEIAGVV